jgi:hypothetical protein
MVYVHPLIFRFAVKKPLPHVSYVFLCAVRVSKIKYNNTKTQF